MTFRFIFVLLYAHRLASSCKCVHYAEPAVPDDKRGKALVNRTYVTLTIRSLALCAARCLRQGKCQSINYDKTMQLCALNSKTHLTEPGQFVLISNADIVYHPISDWAEVLPLQCASHLCDGDQICTSAYLGPGQPTYVCRDSFGSDIIASDLDFGTIQPPCSLTASCTDCTPNGFVNGKQYRAVGCYHSPSTKVLSITVQNLRPDIDWYNLSATVNNCAALSSQYELFGIEFYGECYATTSYYDADFSRGEVAVHQCDSKCANGVGAASVMFVYQWI